MSLVSQLEKGQITPAQFVTEGAADIAGYVKILGSIPGVSAVVSWALDALGSLLTSKGIPATVVELIIHEISLVLSPPAPTVVANPLAPPAPTAAPAVASPLAQ